MKLYLQYLKLTISNAFKNPKNALKILPGLGFLIIGFGIFAFQLLSPASQETIEISNGASRSVGILYLYGISMFMLVIVLFSIIFNTGVGFRAADANFLMKAPVANFDAFIFVNLKQMIMMIGLGFFMSGTQASGIKQLTGNNNVLALVPILFVLTAYLSIFIGYIVLYFKLKNKTITLLVYIPILVLIGLSLYLVSMGSEIPFAENPRVHMVPIFGWAFGIYSNFLSGNPGLVILYFGLYIVTIAILFFICKGLKFDYYEFELSKVAKTEARFQKAMSGQGNNPKLFVKSNKKLKTVGDRVILDVETLRTGKFWFVSLTNIMRMLFVIGMPIAANFIMKESGYTVLIPLAMVCAVRLYVSSFEMLEGRIYKDFYLKLFPITTWKKVVFSNVTSLKTALLEAGLFTASLVISTKVISNYAFEPHLIVLAFIAYLVVCAVDSLVADNIIPFINQKWGSVLALIINVVETLLKGLLLFGGSLFLMSYGVEEIVLGYAITIMLIYGALMLYLAITIYNKTDFTEYNN